MAALATLPLLKAIVPEGTLKRAREIASLHKLRDVQFEGPGLEKSVAACSGSNEGDSYSVSVIVNAEAPSKPVCQCSCPAAAQARGNLCKHVVALLLVRIKEVAKVSQPSTNATVSEAGKEEQRQDSPVDSNATEPFVQSPAASESVALSVAIDNFPADISVSRAVESNKKRVLPSWMSVEFGKESKRGATKRVKKNETEDLNEGEGKVEACVGAGETDKKSGQSERAIEEKGSHSRSSRARRGSRSKNAKVVVQKYVSKAAATRKKSRVYVQSDLSEKDEPEVVDSDYPCSNDLKDGLDLTSEDLVDMAKKHLEVEESTGPEECANNDNHNIVSSTLATKKKGSIFSVEGWKKIATDNLDAKNVLFSQEVSEKPYLEGFSSVIGTKKDEIYSQDNGEPCLSMPASARDRSGKNLEIPERAENVVEDMLGLFFGPSLSKAANSKTDCTQAIAAADVTNSLILSDPSIPEVDLPKSIDSVPKPKKKGSLKDKVMMFLGD